MTHAIPRPDTAFRGAMDNTPRAKLTDKQKVEIIERQSRGSGDGRQAYCTECGTPLLEAEGGIAFDHKVPLWAGGEDSTRNLRAICQRPCHLEKTRQEASARSKAKSVGGLTGSKAKVASTKERYGI